MWEQEGGEIYIYWGDWRRDGGDREEGWWGREEGYL